MVGKVNKVNKLESSSGNRHLKQLSGSSRISKASTSKRVSCLKENEVKKLISRSSNNHHDGIKTTTAKSSCTRPVTESPSPNSNGATLLNKNKVKPSLFNIRQNATWGSRLLSYFGWSNSKPSKPEQAIARPIKPATEVIKEEPSSKKDSRPVTKKFLVASPKVGNPCSSSNIERDSSKFHIHQPRKEPSPYNLRKKVEKSEVVKDFVVAPKRKKINKLERTKASTVQEPVDPQGSLGIEKREIQREEKLQTSVPEVSAAPVKKIGTTNTSTQYQADPDELNHPSSSHYEPYADDDPYTDDDYEDAPIYHIKWDGDDDEEHWRCGQTCLYCEKDLSCAPDGVEHGPRDDDDEFKEYKYRIEFTPRLLPAVDFLPCGHAFHTKCLTDDAIPESQSADPVCVLCLSMF